MIATREVDPGVSVVFDKADHPESVRWCLRAASADRHHLAVTVTPDTRGLHRLGADVLEGLGKQVDISASSTTANETWFRACAWAIGERITEIVVVRAHLLDRFRWERLIELAAVARARLWLVVHRPSLSRGQRETVRDWGARQLSFADFKRRFPRARGRTSPAAKAAPFPRVPDDEFPTFLTTCQAVLPADHFQQVSNAYWSAHQTTATHLSKYAAADRDALAELLSGLLAPCTSLDEMLARARGAQAAAFLPGWLIKVNAEALAGAFSATPISPLNNETCDALRQYSHPRYAAAAVIALAAREPASVIVGMNLGDVEPDGARARLGGRSVAIPSHASGLIRAQLAYRLTEAADPDEPLFIAEKRDPAGRQGRRFGRLTPHGLHQQLAKAALETGLSLLTVEDHGGADRQRRLRRQGITIHKLPDP